MLTGEGITVEEHLRNVGVIKGNLKPYDCFEKHVKDVEEKYWKRFKVFKEWQVNQKENKHQINTSIYPQGMFYLIFEDNKGKITQSFMVK
jgi:hypothetical protein